MHTQVLEYSKALGINWPLLLCAGASWLRDDWRVKRLPLLCARSFSFALILTVLSFGSRDKLFLNLLLPLEGHISHSFRLPFCKDLISFFPLKLGPVHADLLNRQLMLFLLSHLSGVRFVEGLPNPRNLIWVFFEHLFFFTLYSEDVIVVDPVFWLLFGLRRLRLTLAKQPAEEEASPRHACYRLH